MKRSNERSRLHPRVISRGETFISDHFAQRSPRAAAISGKGWTSRTYLFEQRWRFTCDKKHPRSYSERVLCVSNLTLCTRTTRCHSTNCEGPLCLFPPPPLSFSLFALVNYFCRCRFARENGASLAAKVKTLRLYIKRLIGSAVMRIPGINLTGHLRASVSCVSSDVKPRRRAWKRYHCGVER